VACLLVDNIRTVVFRGVSVPDQLAVQEANSSWILNAVLLLTPDSVNKEATIEDRLGHLQLVRCFRGWEGGAIHLCFGELVGKVRRVGKAGPFIYDW
jgi:hypothetical protein